MSVRSADLQAEGGRLPWEQRRSTLAIGVVFLLLLGAHVALKPTAKRHHKAGLKRYRAFVEEHAQDLHVTPMEAALMEKFSYRRRTKAPPPKLRGEKGRRQQPQPPKKRKISSSSSSSSSSGGK